jgi:hypothetical protein
MILPGFMDIWTAIGTRPTSRRARGSIWVREAAGTATLLNSIGAKLRESRQKMLLPSCRLLALMNATERRIASVSRFISLANGQSTTAEAAAPAARALTLHSSRDSTLHTRELACSCSAVQRDFLLTCHRTFIRRRERGCRPRNRVIRYRLALPYFSLSTRKPITSLRSRMRSPNE